VSAGLFFGVASAMMATKEQDEIEVNSKPDSRPGSGQLNVCITFHSFPYLLQRYITKTSSVIGFKGLVFALQ
jgi:hypothetical protein